MVIDTNILKTINQSKFDFSLCIRIWTARMSWMEAKLQCRTLQCRIESVLKKLIRSQLRVIIIGRRMTLHRRLASWIG